MPVARHAVRHHTGQQRLDARSINVDIRVLSATNIDLETSLAQGRLRRDLFYRLASVTLRLPPLRDRQSDIPILVDYYIKQFSKSWLIEPPHLSASVLGALCNHDWPGNIRELRNVVSRLLLHSLDGAVTEALVRETLHEWDNISGQTAKPAQLLSLSAPAEIPLQASSRGNDTDLPSLEENERAHILEALRLTGGRLSGPRGCCGPAEGATVHAATQNTQAGYSGVAPPGHPTPEGVSRCLFSRGNNPDHLWEYPRPPGGDI